MRESPGQYLEHMGSKRGPLLLVQSQECPDIVSWCEWGSQEWLTRHDCISDAFSVTLKPTAHRSPTSLRKPSLLLLFVLGLLLVTASGITMRMGSMVFNKS